MQNNSGLEANIAFLAHYHICQETPRAEYLEATHVRPNAPHLI
jgi:hypothetical protein